MTICLTLREKKIKNKFCKNVNKKLKLEQNGLGESVIGEAKKKPSLIKKGRGIPRRKS